MFLFFSNSASFNLEVFLVVAAILLVVNAAVYFGLLKLFTVLHARRVRKLAANYRTAASYMR